ncbi:TIGR01906 family membrane protein [Clostridium luticellarii]|nr:TIGR01906 family membrane protein [Clostridium luticellarii]
MFLSLIFALFIILISIKFTLMFKPLYYFDVQYLKIEKISGFSRTEIINNYNYIINYILNPAHVEFDLPSMHYSRYGQIHFEEVKRIFNYIDILLILTGIINAVGLYFNIRNRSFNFFKRTYLVLLAFITIPLIAFIINFNISFVVFHKIFFKNNYWLFDPKLDPIINILPQEFFYHSALLILIFISISILTLRVIYKKLA